MEDARRSTSPSSIFRSRHPRFFAYDWGVTSEIENWLRPFALDERLHAHTAEVIASLPSSVRDDLMGDPAFSMCDYQPGPGVVMHVPVRFPPKAREPARTSRRELGRTVVLKRTLLARSEPFVRWVIAHELAHAHLRNAGRWPGDDPEHAADALAEGWGFPRPRLA
jgi:hypothetical protein